MTRKPKFSDALAQPAPVLEPDQPPPAKAKDGRVNMTVRLSPEGLEALKVIAAGKRIRVNDLALEGLEMVLAINGRKVQLRK